MNNIMDKYIDNTEKNIHKYMKMIFNSYYDKDIVSEYINTYINIRYYNIYNGKNMSRPFYLKIMDELNQKAKILKNKYGKESEKIVEDIKKVFNYILFFDNVRKVENFTKIESIKEVIEELATIREKEFGIKNKEDFNEKLYAEIVDDMINKDIYLDKFDTDDFSLKFEKIGEDYIYKTWMDYEIKVPKEYSKMAIDKVFNKGIIGEDKLEVEYTLLSIISIRDILEGNFKDIYLAEFKTSLFNKEQKLERILQVLNNQAIQDKIRLVISYEELTKYKDNVLEYVSKGYKFAIELDNSMKEVKEIERLKMFEIILIPKNLKIKNEVTKEKNKINSKYIIL